MTYEERREMLINNVRTDGLGYWDETMSFLLVESNLHTESFAEKARKGLSAAEDLVVVFEPSDMSAAYFGPLKYLDVLKSFFPLLK